MSRIVCEAKFLNFEEDFYKVFLIRILDSFQRLVDRYFRINYDGISLLK